MHHTPTNRRPLPLLFVAGLLLCLACNAPEQDRDLVHRKQFLMGTLVEITVRAEDLKSGQTAVTRAFDEIARIEGLMSHFRPESDISRINDNAGKESFQTVAPETLEVVQEGIRWGERSGGALDITIGPAARLWNFDEDRRIVPDDGSLQRVADLVNYKDIEIRDGNKIRLARPGMALNLSAIAKGYAVDRAIQILKDAGFPDAIVNGGGDLRVSGRRDGKRLWKIGLQHPRKPDTVITAFDVADRAVTTSGDYQRYFIKDGKRYHHILNPRTARPVVGGLASASILAPTAMQGDAMATAVFVLGLDQGMRLIEATPGVEGILIDEAGTLHLSKGLDRTQFAPPK